MFTFYRPEKALLGKSGQKNQNFQFKRKFSTKTNMNIPEFYDDVHFFWF